MLFFLEINGKTLSLTWFKKIILIGPKVLDSSPRRAEPARRRRQRACREPSPLSRSLTQDILGSYINSSNFLFLADVKLFPFHHFIYLAFQMGSDPYHLIFTFYKAHWIYCSYTLRYINNTVSLCVFRCGRNKQLQFKCPVRHRFNVWWKKLWRNKGLFS